MATREGKYQLFLDGNKKTAIGSNEAREVYITGDALRLPISQNDTIIETVNGQIRFNDEKLKETDWTQGADVPDSIKVPNAVYRQTLRDLPAAITSWKDEVVWPEKP